MDGFVVLAVVAVAVGGAVEDATGSGNGSPLEDEDGRPNSRAESRDRGFRFVPVAVPALMVAGAGAAAELLRISGVVTGWEDRG